MHASFFSKGVSYYYLPLAICNKNFLTLSLFKYMAKLLNK